MNSIGRDIFKAIHEGKWLSIEYRNKQGSLTKYWIGIYDIDTRYRDTVIKIGEKAFEKSWGYPISKMTGILLFWLLSHTRQVS